MNSSADRLLLRNARLVTPERTLENGNLLIESGAIARVVESSTEQSRADSEIDLRGLTLFPGFIDIHIHGAAGIDMMAGSTDDLRRVGEFLARHGVTSWLPTLVPAPVDQYELAVLTIGEAMAEQAASPRTHARVLGTHYEGPFVNGEQCGALHREYFRTFNSIHDLETLPTLARENAIHMMTLAPEVAGGIELVGELKKRNWIVSIGHTRANQAVLSRARAAGANHMTHFMNAMTPLHHRDLGAVGWGLIQDNVTIDMIADGIHVDREIMRLIVKSKGADRVSLISDAIAAAGEGDGDYEIWGEKIRVTNGRTSNSRGSIAGSVITMLNAVRMMLSLGFVESDVARMASLNPAILLGIDHECGAIEEGKRADLVALDANLNVRLTVIGGVVAHTA